MSKLNKLASNAKLNHLQTLLNPPRITEDEKKTLQLYFSDDEVVYKALRDCFFGFDLTDEEKLVLKNIGAHNLLRRIFLPEVKKEIPLGQTYDLWQTQDIKAGKQDEINVSIEAKKIILEMIEKSLARLANPELEGVNINDVRDFTHILARNGYISFVDLQIRFIIQFVNMDKLTPEEQMQMIKQNSTK